MSGSEDDEQTTAATIELPEKTYFKIGEVAKLLEVEPYVLRYWETEFDILDPEKTKSGQRVYQREDIELLLRIRRLLYEEMFTIAGARRQLERRRKGEPNYFDLEEGGPNPAGTAVAGDEQLRRELESTRRELAAVQTELEEMEQQLVSAREEAATSARQLDAANQELEEAKRRLREVRSEREEFEQRLSDARRQLETSPTGEDVERIAELEDEVARLGSELENARQTSRERKKLVERLRDGRQKRHAALGSLRQEVETLATLVDSNSGSPAIASRPN